MLRTAASAGRAASRGLRFAPSRILPASSVAIQRLTLSTLAPTAPRLVKASSNVNMAAGADESTTAAVPSGKISQVIGAVVDVHFGKLL